MLAWVGFGPGRGLARLRPERHIEMRLAARRMGYKLLRGPLLQQKTYDACEDSYLPVMPGMKTSRHYVAMP